MTRRATHSLEYHERVNTRPSSVRLRSATRDRLKVVALVVLAIVAIALFPRLRALDREGLLWLMDHGPIAPVILMGAYAVVALIFVLPAFPLDFAAGAHFGFWEGVFWVQLAASLASAVGYWTGRLLLHGLIQKLAQRRPALRTIEKAVIEDGASIIFLTRLSPVLSFSILNVFYGAIRVPFVKYLAASVVGMLPGTALYVYAGVLAGDLSGAPGHPAQSVGHWTLNSIGFAATVFLVIFVTRRAQSLLRGKLGPDSTTPPPEPPANP